jgi:hypothetical protein
LIAELDQHFEDRLGKVQFRGNPIKIYSYDPDREKGNAVYPCIVYLRHEITIREKDKKPDEWIIEPLPEQITITPSICLGGGSMSGPQAYAIRPYSTPVDIMYEVIALSTNRNHNNHLTEKILQAFPPGYTAKIGSYYPLFIHGKPIISNDLILPLYSTSFIITVTDVWLDREEIETYQSIRDISTDWQFG